MGLQRSARHIQPRPLKEGLSRKRKKEGAMQDRQIIAHVKGECKFDLSFIFGRGFVGQPAVGRPLLLDGP